jgi:hypothetical protein
MKKKINTYNNKNTNISLFWKEMNIFLISVNKKIQNEKSTLF